MIDNIIIDVMFLSSEVMFINDKYSRNLNLVVFDMDLFFGLYFYIRVEVFMLVLKWFLNYLFFNFLWIFLIFF